MRRTALLLGFAALTTTAVFATACSSSKTSGFDENDPNANNGNGTIGGGTLGGGDAGSSGKPCAPGKGNYDIPGNNCDDDGDGKVDNPPTCDDGLSGTGGSAEDFARAMGICATAAKDGYGLVSAKFTRGYNVTQAPKPQQHGMLPKFGNVIKPREGKTLGVLSTGFAEEYDGPGNAPFGGISGTGNNLEPNGVDWWSSPFGSGTAPPGFPKAASGCNQLDIVHDVVNLKLELQAPKNASGVKFDFNFYSGEWPAYICSPYNDGFIAYLSAKGFNNGTPDNMSFDSKKNPVSVNNGFFDRCTPGVKTGCAQDAKPATSLCPSGTSELDGTGFGISGKWCSQLENPGNDTSTNGGATGWLTSQAPVQAGETFTLELMIWDTGDPVLDSSVLIDNFGWAEGEVTVATDRPR
jgi:hypothetical protein